MNKLIKSALCLLLVASLGACSKNDDKKEPITRVKVGVVGAYNDQWDTVNEILKDDNIQVELVYFSDYAIPNSALNSGDIDLNAFQHYAFLENDMKTKGYDLVAIGDTLIAPLSIYNNKNKIQSIEDFKNGDKIAIPSDTTNGGRALKILEEIGLIECDPKAGLLPSKLDITNYIVKIEILEAESGILASLLPDCSAALINGGNAFTANLDPSKDAIYTENVDPSVNVAVDRLVNIIAARKVDENNEVYKKVVEAYHSEEVRKTILESYNGAFLPSWK